MRVAVTTAVDRAPAVAAAFAAVGLEPVVLPCIRVEPAPADELARIRGLAVDVDLVVLTSARAARLVWPEGMPAGARFATVGAATAAEVRRLGGDVEVVGFGGGDDLARDLSPRAAGMTVLFPRAAEAASTIVAELAAAGARVREVPAYTTVPVGPPLDPVEAASFASPSAVAGWSLTRSLGGVVIGAIGETTRAALLAGGVTEVVVPERRAVDALARVLARRVAVGR